MREIKFRAWNKDIKEMFEVGQITLKKGTWNYQPENRKYVGISIPYQPSFELMQFTGLYDKNRKEIYEGDILQHEYCYCDKTDRYIVEWDGDNLQFAFENITKRNTYMALEDFYDDYNGEYSISIIGNIYENPELLGG